MCFHAYKDTITFEMTIRNYVVFCSNTCKATKASLNYGKKELQTLFLITTRMINDYENFQPLQKIAGTLHLPYRRALKCEIDYGRIPKASSKPSLCY